MDTADTEPRENPGSSPVIRTGEGLPRGGGVLVYPAYDIRSGAAEEVDAPGGVTVYADPESDLEIWVDVDHGEGQGAGFFGGEQLLAVVYVNPYF